MKVKDLLGVVFDNVVSIYYVHFDRTATIVYLYRGDLRNCPSGYLNCKINTIGSVCDVLSIGISESEVK